MGMLTVKLTDTSHHELKRAALDKNTTVRDLLQKLVDAYLKRKERKAA